MEIDALIGLLRESLFMILVFLGFLIFTMMRGRQSVINLMLALYLALLVSIKFPYYGRILTSDVPSTNAIVMIIIFAVFTFLGYLLFGRLMPVPFEETAFQNLGKKILFALLATVLVMAFSYHALPVTEIITPGSPIQALFGPEQNFFLWLLLPLLGLFFL